MTTATPIEWIWLDARECIGLSDLSHACRLSREELDELVDYGALVPLAPEEASADAAERAFRADVVAPLREACRLRAAFDLDLFTAAILLEQLHRIDALERQLQSLQARTGAALPGPDPARDTVERR